VFSNLFSITLPNIGKHFPGIHFPGIYFPKGNYFPANKRGLRQKILFCFFCLLLAEKEKIKIKIKCCN